MDNWPPAGRGAGGLSDDWAQCLGKASRGILLRLGLQVPLNGLGAGPLWPTSGAAILADVDRRPSQQSDHDPQDTFPESIMNARPVCSLPFKN